MIGKRFLSMDINGIVFGNKISPSVSRVGNVSAGDNGSLRHPLSELCLHFAGDIGADGKSPHTEKESVKRQMGIFRSRETGKSESLCRPSKVLGC